MTSLTSESHKLARDEQALICVADNGQEFINLICKATCDAGSSICHASAEGQETSLTTYGANKVEIENVILRRKHDNMAMNQ